MTRFASGPPAFEFLTRLAARGERVAYADFAFELGLGSPRNLGWLLTPLVEWCRECGLPLLPVIVVRRADGLPSGGYDPDLIGPETARVFGHDWRAVPGPGPADLFRLAVRPPHSGTFQSC